jgi:hypothetical protein
MTKIPLKAKKIIKTSIKGHFHIFTMSFFFIIRLAEERIWYLTKYKKVTKNKNHNETTKMPFKAKKKKKNWC